MSTVLSEPCAVRAVLCLKYALFATFVAFCLQIPRLARADWAIGADIDFDVPVKSSWASSGGGFGVRVGKHYRLPGIALTPEVGFAYASFGVGDDNLADKGPTAYRGFGGVRLGVGEVLRPGIFAHAGIGHLTGYADAFSQKRTAFTWDAGAFLDFTLLPIINLGAHAAYNQVTAKDEGSPFQWVQLGVHAALIL